MWSRLLGHADLAITSVHLRGIDNTETIDPVHERPAPTSPATAGLLGPASTESGASPGVGQLAPAPVPTCPRVIAFVAMQSPADATAGESFPAVAPFRLMSPD